MPDPAYVRDAFARIADRYVLTNHVLSCGVDLWWRRIVTSRIVAWQPARLLDVASGTGDLALAIQRSCPDCEVIASDFCAEMLVQPPDAASLTRSSPTPSPSPSPTPASTRSASPSACATWPTTRLPCAK